MEFSRESPLFEKQLPVYLLKQDDHENLLTFRILQGSQDNNKTHDRVLYFELADDNDPYFLYFLELSEQDFPSLKKEQSILVDFSTFPSKLIELLLLCHQSNSQIKTNPSEVDNNFNKSNDPTYSVKLDTTNGLFSIVESNRFKQLTHISLQLRPGNDASIKSYLASRLSYTTSQLRQVNKDLSYSKDQLNAEISLRREMAEELRELKSSRDNEMHATRNSHAEELLQVQSKAAETLERTRESYQDQLSQLRSTLENTTKSSNDRISELENSLLNEKQDKSASDFKVKELTHFKEQLENEKSSIFTEASELRKLLRESELQRSSIEREVVKQQMRVEALTTQLNDREESILKSNELQKISGESRKSVEDQLQLYRDSLEAVNEKLLSAVNEIKKGNQEIVRLQQENLQMKERLSTKSEVIRKQEALVVELRNKQLEHDKQLQIVQANLSDSKSEYSSLHREYEKAKEKLTESANIIATNQEVITWLNREISRYQLNGGIPLLGAESFDDKVHHICLFYSSY